MVDGSQFFRHSRCHFVRCLNIESLEAKVCDIVEQNKRLRDRYDTEWVS